MKTINELNIGDMVYHDGDSSFCTLSEMKITDIKTKYNPDTGKPYKVIVCGKFEFDGENGDALDNLFYYIKPKQTT